MCSRHGGEIHIFGRLRDCLDDDNLDDSGGGGLASSAEFLERVFDPEASTERGRFTVRPGVDKDLDEKRRVHNGLPNLLLEVNMRRR